MNALEATEFDDTLEPIGAEFDGADGVPDFEDGEGVAEEFESVVPVRVSDERANVPVTEVAERFLKAILAKVPLDRIEELHLFSPLRQGTVETGIAVIAARVILPPVLLAEVIHVDVIGAADPADPVEIATEAIDPIVVDSINEDELIAIEVAVEDVHVEDAHDEDVLVKDVHAGVSIEDSSVDDSSPYADANIVALDEIIDQMIGEEIIAEELAPIESSEEEFSEPPRVRHTVYTARYRLVIKGPERGRWEMDVVDEADAPLLAVETVVRGVQRRAGEDTATVRYSAAQIARALHIDAPVIQ